MDPAGIFSLLAIGGAGALWALRRLRSRPGPTARRLLRATPRVLVRRIEDGELVKVVGRIVAGKPLRAPITHRPCVHWDAVVHVRDGDGQRVAFSWDTSCSFGIDDGTGAAFVDPQPMQLILDRPSYRRDGPLPREELGRLQSSYPSRVSPLSASELASVWFSEVALPVGVEVAVLGRAQRERVDSAGSAANYRVRPERLVIAGSEEELLIVSNSARTFG